MKHLALNIALAAFVLPVAVAAQDITDPEPLPNPNRVLVVDNLGYYKAFMMDRVDQLAFRRVDGEVAAPIEFLSYDEATNTPHFKITKTADCQYFQIAILGSVIADRLSTDEQVINYVRDWGQAYWDDFTDAAMSGADLDPGTKYTVFTVGVDTYGVQCTVSRCSFETPAPPIEGDPKVEVTVSDVTLNSFTLTFVPNDDVMSYYYCCYEAGTFMQQYEMFAPMFGFNSPGEMVKMWGIETIGDKTYTYTGMDPSTDYEVWVQPLDINGNFAELQCVNVSTIGLGGDGEATVEITVGKYEMADWGGEMQPSQFMTFTPNDQTARFRFEVAKATSYDEDPDAVLNYVKSEPFFPGMANWWFFEEVTTDYQIDPNTECVAVACAQNAKNEWGEFTITRFTTPAEAAGAAAPARLQGATPRQEKILSRIVAKRATSSHVPGMAPKTNPRAGSLQLR